MYGLPKGASESWQEVLLLTSITSEAQIEQCKALASRDGYHSFRVAVIDLSAPPNFAKTVNL